MGLFTQIILLCLCAYVSESRVLLNDPSHPRIPLGLPQPHLLFPGIFTPQYSDDFYGSFNNDFYNWHKPNPESPYKEQKNRDPYNYNHLKPTTKVTTTTEHSIENFVSEKVSEPSIQSHEEVTIEDDTIPENDDCDNEDIEVSPETKATEFDEKAKQEDEDQKDKDNNESEANLYVSKPITSESGKTNSDELSTNTEYVLVPINTEQTNAIALSTGNMIVPAVSIPSLNQGPTGSNQVALNNPVGNVNSYSAPSIVVNNNEPVNTNDDYPNSVSPSAPLNSPQNPIGRNNNLQPNAYNIVTLPNNLMTNNVPNSYYLVNNGQAIPLNNGLQTQTSPQMYTLVPINNIGGRLITDQSGNFINQPNQNYVLPNQPGNLVAYNVPSISQPNYVTLNNQPVNLVPLNNQQNQYVTNQPDNLAVLNQPNNMMTIGNQPNNYVVLSQPNNMIAVSNQPNNLVALNSGGNNQFIAQPQPQPNVVQLFALKEDDSHEDTDKRKEMDININQEHDEIHPSEEPTETIDA